MVIFPAWAQDEFSHAVHTFWILPSSAVWNQCPMLVTTTSRAGKTAPLTCLKGSQGQKLLSYMALLDFTYLCCIGRLWKASRGKPLPGADHEFFKFIIHWGWILTARRFLMAWPMLLELHIYSVPKHMELLNAISFCMRYWHVNCYGPWEERWGRGASWASSPRG